MLSLASIPADARGRDPLTIAQLDAHPDAARVWATVEKVREEMREEMEVLREAVRGLQSRIEDAAFDLGLLHAVLTGDGDWDERTHEERAEHVARELLASKQALYEIAEEEI